MLKFPFPVGIIQSTEVFLKAVVSQVSKGLGFHLGAYVSRGKLERIELEFGVDLDKPYRYNSKFQSQTGMDRG